MCRGKNLTDLRQNTEYAEIASITLSRWKLIQKIRMKEADPWPNSRKAPRQKRNSSSVNNLSRSRWNELIDLHNISLPINPEIDHNKNVDVTATAISSSIKPKQSKQFKDWNAMNSVYNHWSTNLQSNTRHQYFTNKTWAVQCDRAVSQFKHIYRSTNWTKLLVWEVRSEVTSWTFQMQAFLL